MHRQHRLTRLLLGPALLSERRLLLLSLLALSSHLCGAQTEPTSAPTLAPTATSSEDPTSIYITIIIIVSILCVVAIFFLIYRMYKRRATEAGPNRSVGGAPRDANGAVGAGAGPGGDHARGARHGHGHHDELQVTEQVKFRGSMSSVENRHERVPSKPIVMTITTPKGTRHVADAFGEYDGKDDDLPGIDEDGEEDYAQQQQAQTQRQTQAQGDTGAERRTQTQTETQTQDPQPQQPQQAPASGPSVSGNVHSESAEDDGAL